MKFSIAEKLAEHRRRGAGKNLIDFGSYVFPEVRGIVYDSQWFHRLISQEIDDLLYGSAADYHLMICWPPRHGKSQIVSRFLPAYALGRIPSTEIIAAGYSKDLQDTMSRDVQRIMSSRAYAEIFPGTKLANSSFGGSNQTTKRTASEFEVVGYNGRYVGCGVGGSITGRGANLGIIDDPVKNREEAESEAYRRRVWDWYCSTFRTRLEKHAKMVVSMTRWHEDDLGGRLLAAMESDPEADKWRVINIPAFFECDHPQRYEHDIRKEDGDPLWPAKYNTAALKKIRASITAYEWSALFQQRPSPRGGGYIKPEHFQIIIEDDLPKGLRWSRGWDLAVSAKKAADNTASVAAAIDEQGNLYLKDMLCFKREWPQARATIKANALFERYPVGIEKAATMGALIADLKGDPELSYIQIKEIPVDGDKLTRALPWVALAERGKVYLVKGSWVQPFLDEAAHFTGQTGGRDDRIDCVSVAWAMIHKVNRTIKAGVNIFSNILPQEYKSEKIWLK